MQHHVHAHATCLIEMVYLCPHILKVFTNRDIQEIPEKYLVVRWSKEATTKIPEHLSGPEPSFGVPCTNKPRYNALCRKMIIRNNKKTLSFIFDILFLCIVFLCSQKACTRKCFHSCWNGLMDERTSLGWIISGYFIPIFLETYLVETAIFVKTRTNHSKKIV